MRGGDGGGIRKKRVGQAPTDGQTLLWDEATGEWVPSDGGGGTDANAIHDNVVAEISAITEKASPVGADILVIEDSAASYAKRRVQITNLPAGGEINDLTAAVTWANVPNANITQGSVTQHVAAIDHDGLLNYAAGEHRTINDVGTGATDLWSASKITSEVATKIGASGVTYENLDANGDVGTGAAQVAQGSHTHGLLHTRSHAMTGVSDHSCTAYRTFYGNASGEVKELIHGSSGQVLTSNGASAAPSWQAAGGGGATGAVYCVSDGVGGQTLSTTPITVNLDTETISHADFSVAADEITIDNAGTYLCGFQVVYDCAANVSTARDAANAFIELNPSGAGYAVVTQLWTTDYWREVSGECAVTWSAPFVVATGGDTIRLRTRLEAGTAAWPLEVDKSHVWLVRLV